MKAYKNAIRNKYLVSGVLSVVKSRGISMVHGVDTMKTEKEWAPEIVDYIQKNPVTSMEEVLAQIETIVGWVQKDALASASAEEIRIN